MGNGAAGSHPATTAGSRGPRRIVRAVLGWLDPSLRARAIADTIDGVPGLERVCPRLAWVDMLRGAALGGMVVYHGAWDLHAFGLLGTDPSADVLWRGFGNGVAGLFFALSGFALSLAERQGVSLRRTAGRLGRIAVAAGLVTAVTRVAVPETPIWFGILHCIVVTNVVALALRQVPTGVLLAVAAAASAAPTLLRGLTGTGLSWLGLAALEPATLDFRPVLPWLAPVLGGMALGRGAVATWQGPGRAVRRLARPLSLAGQHSLAIYLLHQPLMVGALMLAVGPVPRSDRDLDALRRPEQARAFLKQCRDTCVGQGGDVDLCASTCHCVLTGTGVSQSRGEKVSELPRRSLEAAAALCRDAAPAQGR